MFKLLKILIPVALAAMLSLAGCVDDVYPEEPLAEEKVEEERAVGTVFLRLQIDPVSGMPDGSRGASRADATGGEAGSVPPAEDAALPDSVAGAACENAINSVCIFVYNVDEEDPEKNNTLVDVAILSRSQIGSITSPGGALIDIDVVDQQKVRLYAAVNFTPGMRENLIKNSPYGNAENPVAASISSKYNDYWDVMNELVPGSDGLQSKLESKFKSETNHTGGIPMTGHLRFLKVNADGTTTPEEVVQITPEYCSSKTPLRMTAKVRRMVAKVHVLAKTNNTYPEYVVAEGNTVPDQATQTTEGAQDDFENWLGWIRADSVRYIPNATNKSTYLFPQANTATGSGSGTGPWSDWMDKNMTLKTYLAGSYFDELVYNNDFVTYHGVSLHRVNISPDHRMGQAESYNDNKEVDLSKCTSGMYCTENYFDNPETAGDNYNYKDYDDALPMVTHVYVAAKLVPRDIVLRPEYNTRIQEMMNEYDKEVPANMLKKYGLSPDDFSIKDVNYWNDTIVPRYFPELTEDVADNNNQEEKYKPRKYLGYFNIFRMASQKDADYILKWSLISTYQWSHNPQDFESDRYPANTFYVYDRVKYDKYQVVTFADSDVKARYLFFAPGALVGLESKYAHLKSYSVPHVGGWGYYYTYLDHKGMTENYRTPYSSSQVTRNTYYIVRVSNFGTPGGTITRPEYIKANTKPVGWDYAGSGKITLH